jgi:formylglycine-generating enzyme required for sulfatase activity
MTDPASRFRLFQLLADLPPPQFEGLLFALNIPSGNIPASSAPQAERVRAVLVWAESPIGCGLKPVAALARDMFGLDAPAFLDDEPATAPVTPAKPTQPPAQKARDVPKSPSAPQPATPKPPEPKPTGPFTEDLGNGTTLEMVHIPAGTFWMGSPENEKDRIKNEGPQHKVQVPEFWMGKYPVTQRQWYTVSLLSKVNREMKPHPSNFKGDRLPVEQVSWEDAVEFCDRLSQMSGTDYRLPSEAEWEYACRADTTTRYYFGDDITGKQVNCDFKGDGWFGTYRERTTPVGEFAANKFGLYDMHGNVLEWCQDVWHENYKGAPADGSAWLEGGNSSQRVWRGGSWYHYPKDCRSAYRSRHGLDYDIKSIGFRVVCSSPLMQATALKTF